MIVDNRIRTTLVRYFGEAVVAYAEARGTEVVVIGRNGTYKAASRAISRLGVDIDAWPVPAAGLFVVAERTLYLREADDMTLCHEFGHALGCALGGGFYLSGRDADIRSAFASAKSFVTSYAATGLDEYFAECVRAYVEANNPHSPWPPATRARLLAIDAPMYARIEQLFQDMNAEGVIDA